jgi:hypothetical protein
MHRWRSGGWCDGKLRTSASARLKGETEKPGEAAHDDAIGSEDDVTCPASAHLKRP